MPAIVLAVHAHAEHHFSKVPQPSIQLIEGLGVQGDAHFGATVQHRSRVAKDPSQPNLRQVHLLPAELFDELQALGLNVRPGDLGENITTRGVDLLQLSAGTRLLLGEQAVVEITGLRNPCGQIEKFQPGLLAAVLGRTEEGALVRKAGVMGVVVAGGRVQPGDPVWLAHAPAPFTPLQPV